MISGETPHYLHLCEPIVNDRVILLSSPARFGPWMEHMFLLGVVYTGTDTRARRYILSDPSPLRLARMLLAGEQSTWPKMLFIQNRMKIERLIEKGLLLCDSTISEFRGMAPRRDHDSMHLHGQALRSSAESFPESDDDYEIHAVRKGDRRSSVLEELRRQSRVFFDDVAIQGGEETEDSETGEATLDGEENHAASALDG